MAHKLAEETIAEILGYSLNVPDADFANLSELAQSPFVNRQTSSSTALVVCKRWMRIGTPLIYHTAILRSTAQADALAFALKANPDFAGYLKKLRIEGGFGLSVRKILELASGVTDIWLMLHYTSDDKAKPMCAALEKMADVRRLIIYSSRINTISNNVNTRLVMAAVLRGITSWGSLRIVQLRGDTAVMQPIRRTLLAAKQLGELRFSEDSYTLGTFVQECPANIKRICVAWPDPGDGYFRDKTGAWYFQEKERMPPAHLAKVIFSAPAQTACIAPPLNPFYEPMKHTPTEVRHKIWFRVFELLGEDYNRAREGNFEAWGSMKYGIRLECMLVCSEFKDVMLELACRNVKLDGLSKAVGFATCLKKMPHLSSRVETLDLSEAECRHMLYAASPNLDKCFALVLSVLPALVNLRAFRLRFHDYPLRIEQFAALAPVSGTLRELKLHLAGENDNDGFTWSPSPPPVDHQLLAFPSLRRIALKIAKGGANHLTSPPSSVKMDFALAHSARSGAAERGR